MTEKRLSHSLILPSFFWLLKCLNCVLIVSLCKVEVTKFKIEVSVEDENFVYNNMKKILCKSFENFFFLEKRL